MYKPIDMKHVNETQAATVLCVKIRKGIVALVDINIRQLVVKLNEEGLTYRHL